MRIAVDGRSLRAPLTGIGRYTYELCAALAAEGCRPRVYAPDERIAVAPPGVEMICSNGVLPRMVWLQTALPLRLARDGTDILWGPAHRLPIALGPRTVGVVTIHDLVWVHAPETMHVPTYLAERLLMYPSLLRANAVVTVSSTTAAALKERYGSLGKRIVTIYPGASPLAAEVMSDASALTDQGIGRPYALFVGTLEPRKNVPRLIEAYARLAQDVRSRCMLVIVGGRGWRGQKEDILHRVANYGLEKDVRILDYVDDQVLARLYANSRFLVMPSLYEGFGLPVVEANRHGVPALVGSGGSLPEIGGDAALVVDPIDTDSVRSGLEHLIVDDGLRSRLAAAAISNASRFSWVVAARQLLGLFDELRAGLTE
jgi:glycosyltransferase involved in cell wall biosynthesis